MKKWFTFLFLSSFACAAIGAEKISVLIVDGQNNHKWQMTTPILKDALESSGKYTVDVSTSPAKDGDAAAWAAWKPAFSKYAVVLSNYNGQTWPEDVRKSFEDYVNGGGGFVCIHAANNSFRDWKEYNKMIAIGGWGGRTEADGPYLYFKDGDFLRDPTPGRGGSHGPRAPFVVTVRNADHPITKGMPTEWMQTADELYDSLRGPAENVQVLATAYSEKSKKHEPMILCISYGKGRVFHTPMGHDDVSMKCTGFYTTLQRGTEWAATGEVTLPVPANFPSKEAVSPVQ